VVDDVAVVAASSVESDEPHAVPTSATTATSPIVRTSPIIRWFPFRVGIVATP
jgi:hypothetical protein